MPQYYFHSENGELVRDEDGAALADDGAAKVEAVRLAGALLSDQPELLLQCQRWRMLVTNADKAIIFALEIFPLAGRTVTPWFKPSAGK